MSALTRLKSVLTRVHSSIQSRRGSNASRGDFGSITHVMSRVFVKKDRLKPKHLFRVAGHVIIATLRLLKFIVRISPDEHMRLWKAFQEYDASASVGKARQALGALGLCPTEAEIRKVIPADQPIVLFADLEKLVLIQKRKFLKAQRTKPEDEAFNTFRRMGQKDEVHTVVIQKTLENFGLDFTPEIVGASPGCNVLQRSELTQFFELPTPTLDTEFIDDPAEDLKNTKSRSKGRSKTGAADEITFLDTRIIASDQLLTGSIAGGRRRRGSNLSLESRGSFLNTNSQLPTSPSVPKWAEEESSILHRSSTKKVKPGSPQSFAFGASDSPHHRPGLTAGDIAQAMTSNSFQNSILLSPSCQQQASSVSGQSPGTRQPGELETTTSSEPLPQLRVKNNAAIRRLFEEYQKAERKEEELTKNHASLHPESFLLNRQRRMGRPLSSAEVQTFVNRMQSDTQQRATRRATSAALKTSKRKFSVNGRDCSELCFAEIERIAWYEPAVPAAIAKGVAGPDYSAHTLQQAGVSVISQSKVPIANLAVIDSGQEKDLHQLLMDQRPKFDCRPCSSTTRTGERIEQYRKECRRPRAVPAALREESPPRVASSANEILLIEDNSEKGKEMMQLVSLPDLPPVASKAQLSRWCSSGSVKAKK